MTMPSTAAYSPRSWKNSVAARHRQPSNGREVPIFGVSASTGAETRKRGELSGIPKPMTLETLRDLLSRVAAR